MVDFRKKLLGLAGISWYFPVLLTRSSLWSRTLAPTLSAAALSVPRPRPKLPIQQVTIQRMHWNRRFDNKCHDPAVSFVCGGSSYRDQSFSGLT